MRIWRQAGAMAAQTPQQRNRYVDFLRAVSILIVIVGHWLMTTVYYYDSSLTTEHLFQIQPWTQWLTWIFQVMPIFFIVGGFSNAVSIESARRRGIGYGAWLSLRLNRLAIPLLALMLAWAAIAAIMYALDVSPGVIQLASRASLIPTWFLAIYIMVVILAPAMHRVWRRLGFLSFWLLVAIAMLMDLVFFGADLHWPSWSSYFWVWLAIHNLGFAWQQGRLPSPSRLVIYAGLALVVLWLLVFYGPYPLAMVGSPDQNLSNTTPPKITLLALAVFQFGLLMAVERPMRRALTNLRLWTATVLVNSMIMTIYLWHLTLMIVFIGLLYRTGGTGLDFEPGTAIWWITRPLWIAILVILLVPLALLLSPLERLARRADAPALSPLRQVCGAMMLCLGIALLALFGFGGGTLPVQDAASVALIVVGAAVGGLLPGFR
ncbi:MAG: acyltransferase [Gammaproteobacteria bacterium]|nr:acyltransferase [Gammaproteobacteria bacterium]